MNKLKRLIPIVAIGIFPLWLLIQYLFLNELSENAVMYSKLASDGGMNAGQAIWIATNLSQTASTTFKYSAYFTMFVFVFLLSLFSLVIKALTQKNLELEKDLAQIKEKLNV